MSQYHDLNTILTALRTRMIQKKSGTLFIATDDNASARFSLDKGQLTHCSYKRLKAQEAVEAFCGITGGRYSFSNAPFPFRDNSRIDHATALQTLGVLLPKDPPQTKPPRPLLEKDESGQAPPPPANVTPPKKSIRYYRGQRIED